MNICLFFEGTGQGVAGKMTNVTRLRDLCVEDARHFAAWLDKLDVAVAYLGLWDTVDATLGLDVAAELPRNVRRARHAVSRDETRKFFQYVPLKGDKARLSKCFSPAATATSADYTIFCEFCLRQSRMDML